MKVFILSLFLFSFFASANSFIKKVDHSSCDKTVYTSLSYCGQDCVELPVSYNCKYSKLESEMIDDLEKPIKECEGVDTILDFIGFDENGCKITGYEQKESGRKIIVEDSEKKALYDAKVLSESVKIERKKKGALNRLKCQEALDYIGGIYEDLPESSTDHLALDFLDINSALASNRRGKALRLIIEKTVSPEMQELKDELIKILTL